MLQLAGIARSDGDGARQKARDLRETHFDEKKIERSK